MHTATTDPGAFVLAHAAHVPPGPVLDLACGGGRHGRLFRGRGHPVVFVDRDTAAVADLAGAPDVEVVTADLEAAAWPLADRRFAGVVVTHYLWRPLWPALLGAVGGTLIYETFAVGHERYGRPRNPDFLLRPGELLEVVGDRFEVCAFEEVDVAGTAVMQRICARVRPRRAAALNTWSE